MIERFFRPKFDAYFIDPVAKSGLLTRPNVITLLAVIFGFVVIPALYLHHPLVAFVGMVISGYCDVLDGAVARKKNLQSNVGTFLDVLGDRIVEASIIIGLFLYAPATRGLECLLILSSILLCITAFLLIGIFSDENSNKSFYYSPGIIERAEAFIFFGLMMFFPAHFTMLALLLAGLILLTVAQHVRRFLSCHA